MRWPVNQQHALSSKTIYYAIIVNPQNQIARLTPNAIGRLFLKQTQILGSNGNALVPVNNNSGKNMSAFAEGVLNWSGAQLNSYWSRQIFSGGQTPPLSLNSNGKIIAYVSKHTNAISYIPVRSLYTPVKYPKGIVRIMAIFRIQTHPL